jgi:predicted transcriptional regulator
MGQRRSSIVSETPPKHASLNDWQTDEIKKAIKEAERILFATDRDVERTIKKWTRLAD